jgi:hypothetical protein
MVDGDVVDSGAGDVICFQVYDEFFSPITCP